MEYVQLVNFLIDQWVLSLAFLVFFILLLRDIALNHSRLFSGISSQKLIEYMNHNKTLKIIDMRNAELFKKGHIRFAKWVSMEDLDRQDLNGTVVFYDEKGANYHLLKKHLKQNDGNFLTLKGGLNAWVQDNFPLHHEA